MTSSQWGWRKVCLTWSSCLWGPPQENVTVQFSSDPQGDQRLVAHSPKFFFCSIAQIHQSPPDLFQFFVTLKLFLLYLYLHLLVSHYWPPMTLFCGTQHSGLYLIESCHFSLHFSSLVIQNYFSTVLPPLHHVRLRWASAKLRVRLTRHLSLNIRKTHCHFPSEITLLLEDANPLRTCTSHCQTTLQPK